MPLSHLEHALIQTADMEGTKNWYVDVLGMKVGPHPDFKVPVYWLYIGDTDVLLGEIGGSGSVYFLYWTGSLILDRATQ